MSQQEVLKPLVVDEGGTFEPVIGDATQNLGEFLVKNGKLASQEDFKRVRTNALDIVRRCLPFSVKKGSRTGLVVGYVQSGKTLSMEAVVSVGRDNGCRLVILLAGVTTNLLKQNAERFQTDLRGADGAGNWLIVNSQDGRGRDTDKQALKAACMEWRDPDHPEADKRTLVYAVLKNHAHLDWIRELLTSVDLTGVPSIIIDDEADQAGLNVSPDEEPSTTYARILALRDALPHHTYLQYTATPQAPLLISIDDLLSPAFAELVEPGTGYTGGEVFFASADSKNIVRNVPALDHFKPGKPPDDVPESLLEALAVFVVGCAVARIRKKPKLRSMLVHPSPRKTDHQHYLDFIKTVSERWHEQLSDKTSPDRNDALMEIRAGYTELMKTVADLPPFDALIPTLKVTLSRLQIKLVNSEDASEVDWKGAEEHILVGGEKLNRGYTVEGLTVTYMPRDAGGWNADTLQQRARFFGYKQSYLDLCRLYLHPDVASAFRHYVEHERDIRKQLSGFRGRPLREWRRAFFLDPSLKPTRTNVLSELLYRTGASPDWWRQRLADPDAAKRNETLVAVFLKSCTLSPADAWGSAPDSRHQAGRMRLDVVIRDLLSQYAVPTESWGLVAQVVMLTAMVDKDPDAEVLVVRMSPAQPRKRSTDAAGQFPLFQGRSTKKDGTGYIGDELVRDGKLPTLQIHRVAIAAKGDAATHASEQYAIALFNPEQSGVVVQRQKT